MRQNAYISLTPIKLLGYEIRNYFLRLNFERIKALQELPFLKLPMSNNMWWDYLHITSIGFCAILTK